MNTMILILAVVAVAVVLALGIGWIRQIRGARRFDERYEKMSEGEKRAFEQGHTSTKLG